MPVFELITRQGRDLEMSRRATMNLSMKVKVASGEGADSTTRATSHVFTADQWLVGTILYPYC